MPPPSCVSLFNAVCNTFNVPSFPPRHPLPCPLCIHPSCNFRGGREGVSPPCSWRHACLHCLRETHACSRIRCPLRMTMHLFFSSIFFFFRFIFRFLPSLPLFYANIPRVRIFVSRPPPSLLLLLLPPRWKIKCENVVGEERRGGRFQPLERRESGKGVGLFNLKTYRFVSRFRAIYRFDFSRC